MRYQIGRRLFEEVRYRDAAAEFEWSRDLDRTAGRAPALVQTTEAAMTRARELAARSLGETRSFGLTKVNSI